MSLVFFSGTASVFPPTLFLLLVYIFFFSSFFSQPQAPNAQAAQKQSGDNGRSPQKSGVIGEGCCGQGTRQPAGIHDLDSPGEQNCDGSLQNLAREIVAACETIGCNHRFGLKPYA